MGFVFKTNYCFDIVLSSWYKTGTGNALCRRRDPWSHGRLSRNRYKHNLSWCAVILPHHIIFPKIAKENFAFWTERLFAPEPIEKILVPLLNAFSSVHPPLPPAPHVWMYIYHSLFHSFDVLLINRFRENRCDDWRGGYPAGAIRTHSECHQCRR